MFIILQFYALNFYLLCCWCKKQNFLMCVNGPEDRRTQPNYFVLGTTALGAICFGAAGARLGADFFDTLAFF